MRRSLLVATLSLALAACGEEAAGPADGNLYDPGIETVQVLRFPTVEVGRESSVEAVVRAGSQPLFLQPVELEPPFSSDLRAVEKVEARAERRIRFTFRPTEPGRFDREVQVRAGGSVGRYRLEAEAIPAPEPCLPRERVDVFADIRSVQDVLLVLDDHRSMEAVREALRAEAPSLLVRLDWLGIDWRLAVTTAGMGDDCPGGDLRPGTPIDAGEEDAVARLDQAVQPPTCGGAARGIEAALAALPHFAREGAALSLVVISTRDDRSPLPLEAYAAAFGARQVRALVVVGDEGGHCPLAEPGTRWASFAAQVGGARRSLCADDWELGAFFGANSSFGVPLAWKLEAWPWDGDEDGAIAGDELVVRLDGVELPSSTAEGKRIWRYDAEANAVVFFPETAPRHGQTIEVAYLASCSTASSTRATSAPSL